jgi:hypothetical protein
MRGYFGEYTPGLITAATITPLAGVIICPHLCSTRRLFVGDVAVTPLAACMVFHRSYVLSGSRGQSCACLSSKPDESNAVRGLMR